MPPPNSSINRHLPAARATSLGTAERRNSSNKQFAERRRSSILVGQRSIDLYAMNSPIDQGPKFVKFIIRQYKKYGYFISRHDWKAMLICMVISLACVVKIVFYTEQKNSIIGYSPYGARGKVEYARYQEFFAANGLGIATYIFALAKDGKTMLRNDHLNETLRVLDLALNNITIFNRNTNKSESFNDFCISFCTINDPIRAFYNGFVIQNELAQKGEKLSSRLELKYPTSRIFGREISLQQNFFGLEIDDNFAKVDENDVVDTISDTALISVVKNDKSDEDAPEGEGLDIETRAVIDSDNITMVSNMKMVKMISIQIRSEHMPGWTDDDVKKYEMDIVHFFEKKYHSKNLQLYVLSTTYVEEEMVRAGLSLLPYLVVGFLIMCTCSIITVLLRAFYMQQQSFTKILLAFLACIVPFMSCATALGILFICGMRFASILCVIPFLVLAIAVDSSYLMIHEWQRVVKHCREHPSRKTLNIGFRVLSEVGPAILISALTNIFADAIGTFTGSPEITLLCVGNLFAMFIAFIYQMTFYAGLMSLVGRYEISVEKKEMPEEVESAVLKRQVFAKHKQLTRTQSKFHDETKHVISESMQAYVKFVSNKIIALMTIALYFTYLAVSIWGIMRIEINLTTQKLFALDSPLIQLDKLRVKYQVPHFTMATVFVNKPGNLSNTRRLKRINALVEDMEALKGSWGPVGTKYFIRDFLIFESSFEDVDITDVPNSEIANKLADLYKEDDLKTFVDWPEYSYWGGFIRFKNGTNNLDRFFFTTAYHGKEISIWTERAKLLNQWRNVADRYAHEFDVSVFHEDGVFLDLIENMPTDTWQSVLGVLICMAAVCFIFLNSLFTVVMASSCVLSICTGILGILSWWHIDLDPITMAAMIISIGFSVDIPAHVSYHYHQAGIHEGKDSTPQQRLANCLSSVAFPAVQAGLSTMLCVCSLMFVQLYMAEVFFKTMILCVILCNLHGLVFLPAFLIMFDWIVTMFKSCFDRNDKVQQQISDLDGIGEGITPHRRSTKLDTVFEKSSSQETSVSSENGKTKI